MGVCARATGLWPKWHLRCRYEMRIRFGLVYTRARTGTVIGELETANEIHTRGLDWDGQGIRGNRQMCSSPSFRPHPFAAHSQERNNFLRTENRVQRNPDTLSLGDTNTSSLKFGWAALREHEGSPEYKGPSRQETQLPERPVGQEDPRDHQGLGEGSDGHRLLILHLCGASVPRSLLRLLLDSCHEHHRARSEQHESE